jgi:hypothetical protein
MYCPKCAAPIDGVKFCRQCGANVSLVPQALTGQLPVLTQAASPALPTQDAALEPRQRKHRHAQPAEPTSTSSMAHAFNHILFGLGFLVAAALVSRNASWGWVFIFPAMGAFGKAVSEYYRAAEARQQTAWQPPANASLPVQAAVPSIPVQVPTTAELKLPAAAQDLAQPVSVTEHTTALLDPAQQKTRQPN